MKVIPAIAHTVVIDKVKAIIPQAEITFRENSVRREWDILIMLPVPANDKICKAVKDILDEWKEYEIEYNVEFRWPKPGMYHYLHMHQ